MSSDKYMATVTVDVIGETTHEKFPGVFKVRTRLSFRDALRRDEIRRSLLGPNPDGASPRATSIADICSELTVRIVESPSWWGNSDGGLELSDDNVLREVFESTMRAVSDAANDLQKKGEAAKKALAQE